MLTKLAMVGILAVTVAARGVAPTGIEVSSPATLPQDSAAQFGRNKSTEQTPDRQNDDTPQTHAVADGPAAGLVPILALGFGLLGCAMGGLSYVLLRSLARDVDRHAIVVASTQNAVDRLQTLLPNRAEAISRPGQEVLELRDRLHHLEHLVARLQDHARAVAVPFARGPDQQPEMPSGRDVDQTDPAVTEPSLVSDTIVGVFPGTLSDDSVVKLSTSSKPMVEIHWQDGASTAQVWVNSEYKFADLNARYLESAFDVDVMGPGSFETVSPAIVDWTRAANSGRVVARGRVRAVART